MKIFEKPWAWAVLGVAVVAVVATFLLANRSGPAIQAHGSIAAYEGLGSWVDIYDDASYGSPATTVERMHAQGVRTIFLETSNYKTSVDLFDEVAVARFLDAAHADGMRVVAWVLPSFDDAESDMAKVTAAVDYESPDGQAFDGFALDIEPGRVTQASALTSGVLDLSSRIRQLVGDRYALGAIIPSPVALAKPSSLWDGFPYGQLAHDFDVFLPMGYYTFSTDGPGQAADYTRNVLAILRTHLAEAEVHVVGGLAQDSDAAEVRAFARVAAVKGALGYSLYDDATTSAGEYGALRH